MHVVMNLLRSVIYKCMYVLVWLCIYDDMEWNGMEVRLKDYAHSQSFACTLNFFFSFNQIWLFMKHFLHTLFVTSFFRLHFGLVWPYANNNANE